MEPGQDRAERHRLVQGQVDHAGDHSGDARDEEHRRDGAHAAHVRRELRQEPAGHELQGAEGEDDPVRGALMQELVQGERDDADQQQADPERRHQDGRDADGAGVADGSTAGGPGQTHVRRDAGGGRHRAAGDDAGVERGARRVGEHPEAAEVQVPPQRVGCRQGGHPGHEAEDGGGEEDPGGAQSPARAGGGGQVAVGWNGGLCTGWHRVPII
ncbi:hypothetical protein FVP74_02520 [Microbacterium saccharophilum]|uniref:Uncharacterized protein n=1 Tax=Microbacterium saccharophilum TaxID=1213358 RepID=A0A5C8IAC4_9MICO|nr:hypothetical protein [Microbacterium saccharophilum]TXK15292.1 hypothetical protein FVP74_02520 [Microbacterium saccharophilum]